MSKKITEEIKIGIYMISSKSQPAKFYIGSSVNIKKRLTNHFSDLKRGVHHSELLQKHYVDSGLEDLVTTILEECEKENLIIIEQKYVNSLSPSFNTMIIVDRPTGLKRSEEAKKRMSLAKIGKKPSLQTRLKMSESHKGKSISEDQKQLLSRLKKGVKQTEKQLKINSDSHKKLILDFNSGVYYLGSQEAAETLKMSSSTLRKWLINPNRNKTSLRYV